jgi:MoaA/NifB/PqqE/SkfB family radical SAM enzyme
MRARLEITTRCNLNCMHCGATEYRISQEWSTEEACAAFQDMISHGVGEVDFLGGEPFIREDIQDLLSFLDERHCGMLISTNGLLLDDDMIDFLTSLTYLMGVSFSIDGASKDVYETIRGKGNYETVLSHMEALSTRKAETESQFSLGLTCVINRLNAGETGELVALADQFDFNNVSFINIGWFGNAKKNKDKLSIHPVEEYKAYDRGARKVAMVNKIRKLKGSPPLSFSIDSMPTYWKYHLVRKYPLVSQVGGNFKCQAGTATLYLDALGVLYPCEAVRIHLESIESEIGEYQKMSLPEYSYEEVVTSESFKKAVEYVHNKKGLYQGVDPCGTCVYAEGCSVCPLYARSEKVIHWCSQDTITHLS